MGFLSFTLQLIDFLAWPVLALGYPICASIRAIETGSKYHMRKLVTYWTIFSFISLFEHLLEKLIEWVPLWPYIKLITMCWLVIPEFNGACYFYQHLVHPCLPLKLRNVIAQFYGSCYVYQCFAYLCSFVNLQTFTGWFNKPMEDPSLKNETFLQRYLEENGSDALVKLISNKTECEGIGPVWEDIKVMEHMAKHEVAEPKQVEDVKENQIHVEKKTIGMQIEEMVVPADTEEIKLPEITSVKQVQTEWTCAVCQVTTTSEHNLKSHLNGRKHKAKCMAKSEGSSPVTTKSNQLNQAQVKHAAAPQSERSTNEAADPKQVKSVKENLVQIEKKTTGAQIKVTTLPADNTKEIKLRETNSLKNVQKEWTCAVCQVTTKSEHDLKCHLLGRKHREKCEELKTCKKKAKTERNPSSASNKPDQLKQEQVKHARSAQITRSTNEKPKEKVQLGATGQYEKQKQVKNAVGVTHSSKLWCRFCNVRCPGEIDMAAHLKGRKHLAKLQETMV
ncbi:PREDICTED: uncharacterized protein LOC109228775 [Nicotiana attenuata]|uniref:Hva22-like protein a n=1 Tax=Nicotiana attenuata TaxID=49451 RepID=A0A1J6IR77_NICAT|nr:PREDICTED: uncharacterized protein LOC109228775 [Nicotiana attenuata]OIT00231.1 hva22-like protein a [Nicotiana attenuata]